VSGGFYRRQVRPRERCRLAHLVRNWPILDIGVQPDVPLERWRLTMTGLVEQPGNGTDDFLAQPQRRMRGDIHCVTAWSRYDNEWSGVSARHLLSVVKPKPETTHLYFHAYDGYTTNVPLTYFADDDVLLAHSWMGEALSRDTAGRCS
jgi:DMSO/TMAO reductase YedYZ molybdopterin-dependent catalytic subunit